MTKIVGILNITPDSFSDGGKFNSLDTALNHLKKIITEGAKIIDIGAESTRPTATPISAEEEWSRFKNILPEINSVVKNSSKPIKTSIDSYHFETLQKAVALGIDVVNDVSGLSDKRIVDFIAAKNIETILMHNVSVQPVEGSVINQNINLISEMLDWGRKKIAELEKQNVKKSQLIFDVGIGFGKNALQSIRVLKNIAEFRALKLPLYVGHSKKSFLDNVSISGDRAEKTLIISKYLMQKNVDFLRVHDVEKHHSALLQNDKS